MSTENQDFAPTAPVVETPLPSPGAMIREARDRLRWSLDDLAGQTKLARNRLEALERDDFGALLDPVYVRGYYRKCAKVLEISEQTLLAAYEVRVAPKVQLPPAKLRLASGTELGSSSRLPVSLAIAAAVAAIAVCGFIWLAREPEPQAPATTTIDVEPSAALGAAPEADAAPLESLEAVPAEPVVGQPLEGAAPTPTAPAGEAAATTVPGTTPAPALRPTVPAEAPSTSSSAGIGSGMARLRFEQDSWARVDDANGKMLMSGLMVAGTQRTVGGPLPLSVFLGNAPGVTIEFDGRVIDVKPYQRDNATARFTLPLAAN